MSRIDTPGDGDTPDHIWVSIDTILARWNRPRPAMTCLKAGGSYFCSPAIRIIDYNTTTLTSYSAVLRCHLDDDVLASAAIFRRRRHIPRTSLVASPAPFIPPRLPRNHAHETGGMIRRDGELASWRRPAGWCPFLLSFLCSFSEVS